MKQPPIVQLAVIADAVKKTGKLCGKKLCGGSVICDSHFKIQKGGFYEFKLHEQTALKIFIFESISCCSACNILISPTSIGWG